MEEWDAEQNHKASQTAKDLFAGACGGECRNSFSEPSRATVLTLCDRYSSSFDWSVRHLKMSTVFKDIVCAICAVYNKSRARICYKSGSMMCSSTTAGPY